jgi:hypothetical protein
MTPLIWPQTAWLVAMGVFTLATVLLAVRAVLLALRRDTNALLSEFGPDAVEDELAAELSDLEQRS